MNSEQRKKIRMALAEQGLERTYYSDDHGDGMYVERWASRLGDNASASVLIRWGPRTPDVPKPDIERERSLRLAAHDVRELITEDLRPAAIRETQRMLDVQTSEYGPITSRSARIYWQERGRLLGLDVEVEP